MYYYIVSDIKNHELPCIITTKTKEVGQYLNIKPTTIKQILCRHGGVMPRRGYRIERINTADFLQDYMEEAKELKEKGYKHREIAEELGITIPEVRKVLNMSLQTKEG